MEAEYMCNNFIDKKPCLYHYKHGSHPKTTNTYLIVTLSTLMLSTYGFFDTTSVLTSLQPNLNHRNRFGTTWLVIIRLSRVFNL